MDKPINKKFLMWSVLLIAMVQMPSLALTPGINQIHQLFSDKPLTTIQSLIQLPNLISPFVTISTAFLIGKGIVSKKTVVVGGLLLAGATGVVALLLHSEFWHFVMYCILLGLGLSGYISTASSLIVDNFDVNERQSISGYQTAFVNGGGIMMSLCGGLLASVAWFGGYLMLMIAIPVAIVALFAIPAGKQAKKDEDGQSKSKIKLHTDVFMYAAIIFVFMSVYNVLGANISTHLASLDLGNTAVSGYITAIRMLGGVVSGVFFSKISKKLNDFTTILAFVCVFIDMTLLSVANSIVVVVIGEFIGGMALSLLLPQCLFSVSKVVNKESSALATSITQCIGPSLGSFLSAIIFTNITTKLYGDSTVMRYRFVSIVAIVCAAILFVIFTIRKNRKTDTAA